MRKIFLLIIIIGFMFFPNLVFAHPGNTAADGCHYCRTNCDSWGVPWGERHCHGGSPPPPPPSSPPPPVCPGVDEYKANFNFIPNNDGKTFTVNMNWSNLQNTGYSLSLNDYQNSDPGPLSDTTSNSFSFSNITSGPHYVHLKIGRNYQWCNPVYWTISVPNWYPPLPTPAPFTPAPTPLVMADTEPNDSRDDTWILALIGIGVAGYLVYSWKTKKSSSLPE